MDTPTEFKDDTIAKRIAMNGILLLLAVDKKSPNEDLIYDKLRIS